MPAGIDRNARDSQRAGDTLKTMPELVWNEIPIGTIDGSNGTFSLLYTPRRRSDESKPNIMVFSDGVYLPPTSYTVTKKVLVIATGKPATTLRVMYEK